MCLSVCNISQVPEASSAHKRVQNWKLSYYCWALDLRPWLYIYLFSAIRVYTVYHFRVMGGWILSKWTLGTTTVRFGSGIWEGARVHGEPTQVSQNTQSPAGACIFNKARWRSSQGFGLYFRSSTIFIDPACIVTHTSKKSSSSFSQSCFIWLTLTRGKRWYKQRK